MRTYTIKLGKSPDEMTFDECMAHIKRVLFWDYIDGEWCDVVPLSDRRWEELAGYIRGAHEREVNALMAENAKLRELARRLLTEYRYMRSRPRRVYLGHEKRMRAIEDEMRALGIEVDNDAQ